MPLSDQLIEYVHAAFTGLWVVTHEADEAEREIVQLARSQNWKTATWDIANGLRLPSAEGARSDSASGGDPLPALRALPGLAEPNGTSLLILHNFHKFLTSPEVMQTTFSQLVAGKQQRTFLVVLSPVVQIPVELEKVFVVIEHAMPDREQLARIADELTSDQPGDRPSHEAMVQVLDAASGLTRYEAEGAFALSLTRHNVLQPDAIWELKAQTLKKNNLLTLHRGDERFESLGGLSNLKEFCRRALRPGQSVKPRGILLLGVPGSGKSCFSKALGNEIGRPTLMLDIGSLMGSLVGSTEANIRQALKITDAMSPCVLHCDEVEKALSGLGGVGDGGVSTRLFGTVLTWLSDHTSDVFVIMTANDISKLPPEFARAERFDGVFFLDLPSRAEKDLIWKMYREQFAIATSQTEPNDSNWTGAEIRSCCRLAALLDLPLSKAAEQVVPVAVTAGESVEKLRSWASGRCLNASASGVYQRGHVDSMRSARRISTKPSNN